MALSQNYRAAAFMALAMSGFTINDVIVKTITHEINVGQVMFVRGLMMIGILALLLKHENKKIKWQHANGGPMKIRVGLEAVATVLFLVGFANLQVANASAIMQALPLAVTLGAIIFLKEPVGWRRISAILIGFVGVLIIIRPGSDGFNIYSGFMLATVVLAAGRDLATRKLDREVSSLFVSLLTAIAVTILGLALIVPLGGWQPMTLRHIAILAIAACFLFIGYQFIVVAMRDGDIATVAPFRYTSLLWSVLLGYLVFDNLPDQWTLIGGAIVVGSGLYSLLREHQRSRSINPATESASNPPAARGV